RAEISAARSKPTATLCFCSLNCKKRKSTWKRLHPAASRFSRTQTRNVEPLNRASAERLRQNRIRLVLADAQFVNRFSHVLRVDFSIRAQFVQGGQGDELGVDLKEIPQRRAAFAASESVGAESGEAPRHPLGNHVRQRFQIVRSGHQNARCVSET